MKQVKSKVTGAIGELDFDSKDGIFIVVCYDLKTKETTKIYYSSLEDLCEEWEDYEEPEKYFWIDVDGFIVSNDTSTKDVAFETFKQNLKSIGNYFETREEAEKAREKLKAWKRLRDKGIFIYLDHTDFQLQEGSFNFEFKNNLTNKEMNEADEDLDLLFGGEE